MFVKKSTSLRSVEYFRREVEKIDKMLLNQLRNIQPYMRLGLANTQIRCYEKAVLQSQKSPEIHTPQKAGPTSIGISQKEPIISEIFPSPRVMPMMLTNKDAIVLSFDDVPGPRALKYISNFRQYLSEMGTQLTVGALTLALNVGK